MIENGDRSLLRRWSCLGPAWPEWHGPDLTSQKWWGVKKKKERKKKKQLVISSHVSHPLCAIPRSPSGAILIESHKPNNKRSVRTLAGGIFSVYSFQSKHPFNSLSIFTNDVLSFFIIIILMLQQIHSSFFGILVVLNLHCTASK